MGQQSNWRFCQKCHTLFFAGYTGGDCQAGGYHSAQGANNFVLAHDVPAGPKAQQGWRFCENCHSMFFEGYGGGRCPSGGKHSAKGAHFVVPFDVEATANSQKNWCFCEKCHTMFFAGYTGGDCPAGGYHSARGLNFVLPFLVGNGTIPATLALGGGVVVMTFPPAMLNNFIDGIKDGAKSTLPADLLLDLERKVAQDPGGFELGFAKGCVGGLGTGFVSLLKALGEILVVGIALSLPVVLFQQAYESVMLLTSPTYSKMKMRENAWARKALSVTQDTIRDIAVHPNDYLMFGNNVGVALGQFAGTWVAQDFLQRQAAKIGEDIGFVLGRVLFEIVIQLFLAASTEGAGNTARAGAEVGEAAKAVRAGISLGEGAQGGARIAGLAQRLKALALGRPGIRRLILALLNDERGAIFLADAALDAELDAAFGEGAVLQRGASGGFPILERLPGLPADKRANAAKLLGQEFNSDLRAAWNACSNPQAQAEIAEVQRLLGTGSAADREAAYTLSQRTYSNWRGRFWTRVRNDTKLKDMFTEAGATFGGRSSTAPYFEINGAKTKNLTVTLDHFIERRVDNPARAVDALNVRPIISFENSASAESIRRDNFLKGWASP